ncbi:MAG: hypothetical protein IPM24_21985 [Bryobacterales bacterium]|nr:hypothetical protein [Bryobacterales bacterium]
MKPKTKAAVAGLGEVGKPLFDILSGCYDVIGFDVEPPARVEPVDVLHICYPFQIPDFLGEGARYIEMFQPTLTVINSTVSVGTTRALAGKTGAVVVNSPVRGKHVRMLEELRVYKKFIGAMEPEDGARAAHHFEAAGMQTSVLSSPEATELAKLTETTYFGLMIAWAQEVERYCDQSGQKYDEVVSFYEEIRFFPPVKYFPGVIGGHCVLPNIETLRKWTASDLLDAIWNSNRMKAEREESRKAVEAVA